MCRNRIPCIWSIHPTDTGILGTKRNCNSSGFPSPPSPWRVDKAGQYCRRLRWSTFVERHVDPASYRKIRFLEAEWPQQLRSGGLRVLAFGFCDSRHDRQLSSSETDDPIAGLKPSRLRRRVGPDLIYDPVCTCDVIMEHPPWPDRVGVALSRRLCRRRVSPLITCECAETDGERKKHRPHFHGDLPCVYSVASNTHNARASLRVGGCQQIQS